MNAVEQTVAVQAEEAQTIEASIATGCSTIRSAWIALAGQLERFHTDKMWKRLGYENFTEWIAIPEVSLSRSHAYALIEIYRELVVEREVQLDALQGIEATKVREVLPALRRGDVEVGEALSDARSLSRSDLRERYADPKRKLDAAAKPLATCSECGQPVVAR